MYTTKTLHDKTIVYVLATGDSSIRRLLPWNIKDNNLGVKDIIYGLITDFKLLIKTVLKSD